MVRAAQVQGSLALAGAAEEAARDGLARAIAAVDPQAPLSVEALVAWHRAAMGGGVFRSSEAARPGATPPAPPEFIASRLAIFEQWMNALARIVEVKPFDDGNGRISRLAASHLMVRAGARPPILVAADGPRLEQALQAAFQLHTEPLAALLEEAAERALDVMIRAAEAR